MSSWAAYQFGTTNAAHPECHDRKLESVGRAPQGNKVKRDGDVSQEWEPRSP